MKQVLVTGGTGTLGRQVVEQLVNRGYDVSVLTTRDRVVLPPTAKLYTGDLTRIDTLQGLSQYPDMIVHCASDPKNSAVDLIGTSNLLQTINKNKVSHFLYVSIAGVDKSTYAYYRVKYEVENMIKASGFEWTIIRATQFHDLVLNRLIKPFDGGEERPLKIPGDMRFQSIDVKDVSQQILQILLSGALTSTITLGGPEVLTLADMVEEYLSIQGRNDQIERDDAGTEFYDLFRSGVNLCPAYAIGKITWRDFLQNIVSLKA